MNKSFRERFAEFFRGSETPPPITENSSLHEIALQYPHVFDFIERKYGAKVEVGERTLSLKEFSDKFGLPPAQILFMEVQMSVRTQAVKALKPKEAQSLLAKHSGIRFLDVREEWEVKICKLPNSQVMGPQMLDEILTEWPKDTTILLYCHFGIRSLDAATFLADRGFSQVYILQGGIDAWSQDINPVIPRYENGWC